jgi:hypothetical protein
MKNESNPDLDALRDHRLRIMLAEYDWLGDDQKLYNKFFRTDTQIAITVLAGLITLSYDNRTSIPTETLYIAITGGIFVYIMSLSVSWYMMICESKRRSELEKAINRELGKEDEFMRWESQVAPSVLHKWSPLSICIGLLLAALGWVFWYFAKQAYHLPCSNQNAILISSILEGSGMAVSLVLLFRFQGRKPSAVFKNSTAQAHHPVVTPKDTETPSGH